MAIVTESVTIADRSFTLTYSDAKKYILRDGVKYVDALDPSEFGREYTESDEEYEADWEDPINTINDL